MKKARHLLFMMLVAFTMVVAACSSGGGTQTQGGNTEQSQEPQEPQESQSPEATSDNFKTALQLGTGTTGGTYYPLGQEMANVWNNTINMEGFSVSAVSTDSSVANLAGIGRGELQLGMTVHVQANEAYQGIGPFEGAKIENFGFMGHIYPEVMQIVTLESTGINSIADLKGKRVAIGPAGSGTQVAAKLILEAAGLKEGDYQAFHEGFGDAKGKLQDGNVDASFALLGLPAASIDELQALTKKVKYINIDDEILAKIEETTPYKAFEIPASAYEWLTEPVQTVSAFAILVGSTDEVSEELAYEITKSMLENSGNITHIQGQYMTKENALLGSDGLPFHPGSEKYLREAGILQ